MTQPWLLVPIGFGVVGQSILLVARFIESPSDGSSTIQIVLLTSSAFLLVFATLWVVQTRRRTILSERYPDAVVSSCRGLGDFEADLWRSRDGMSPYR